MGVSIQQLARGSSGGQTPTTAAVIYSLMILATSMASPWEGVVAENHLWGTGEVIEEVVGPIGLIILVMALTMGIFTGLNGFIMAGSRLLFAMARAKILPKSFGILHPKYETPYVAVIFTVVISSVAPGSAERHLSG